MARNKNRKKSAGKSRDVKKSAAIKLESAASLEPGQPIAKEPPVPAQKEPQAAAKAKGAGKTPSLVKLSTCAAGMFLTFVAGVYLGSFMPGILNGMEKERQAAMAPAARPAPPVEKQIAEKGSGEARTGERPAPALGASAVPPKPAQPHVHPELAERVRQLEKEALSRPDDSKIWAELGNGYFDSHEPQKAISAYSHSLSLAPKNPDVWTDLGIMYREVKNYDKALECFREASGQNPEHINALFNEGVVLSVDLNRKSEAAGAWKKILEINPAAATPDGQKIADMVRQLQ